MRYKKNQDSFLRIQLKEQAQNIVSVKSTAAFCPSRTTELKVKCDSSLFLW